MVMTLNAQGDKDNLTIQAQAAKTIKNGDTIRFIDFPGLDPEKVYTISSMEGETFTITEQLPL